MKQYKKFIAGSLDALQLHVVCGTTSIVPAIGSKIFIGGWFTPGGYSLVVRQKSPILKTSIMKHILIILVIALASCSRQGVTANLSSEQPEISFDIDGKHYEFKGEQTYSTKMTGLPTIYYFSGYGNTQNMAQVRISTDSLSTTTYSISPIIKTNDEVYVSNVVYIKVTNYKNGTVNAEFNGSIKKIVGTTYQPASLTNGKIINSQLKY